MEVMLKNNKQNEKIVIDPNTKMHIEHLLDFVIESQHEDYVENCAYYDDGEWCASTEPEDHPFFSAVVVAHKIYRDDYQKLYDYCMKHQSDYWKVMHSE